MAGRASPASRPAPAGTASRLALAALAYGEALGLDDAPALSQRLYRYNTLPASPDARRRWPTRRAVDAWLGTDRYDARAGLKPASDDWWRRWHVAGAARPRLTDPCLKLYVSPASAHVRDAFREVMGLVPRIAAYECKVGRDLHGLLRPDKLMVYFTGFADLEAAAERLARALAGMPAQGVPFTAELAGGGLLTWGSDPPRRARSRRGGPPWPPVTLGHPGDSWRRWITRSLADGLVEARRSVPDESAPRWALSRLAADGVDTSGWTPPLAMWTAAPREMARR